MSASQKVYSSVSNASAITTTPSISEKQTKPQNINGKFTFTLEEAQKYAIENNLNLKMYEEKISRAKMDLDKAKDATSDMKSYVSNYDKYITGSGIDAQVAKYLYIKDYYLKSAQDNYDSLLLSKQADIENLKYMLLVTANNIYNIKVNIYLKQQTLSKLLKQLNIVKLKKRLMMATDLQQDDVENQIKSLRKEIYDLGGNRDDILRQTKDTLNIYGDTPIDIADVEPKYIDNLGNINIEQDFKGALTTRVDYIPMKKSVQREEIRGPVLKSIYGENSDTYKKYLLEMKQLTDSLTAKENSIRKELMDVASAVENVKRAYELAKENLTSAEKKLEIEKKKYELGTISKMILIETELAVAGAKARVSASIVGFINEKEKYKLLKGIGLSAATGAMSSATKMQQVSGDSANAGD